MAEPSREPSAPRLIASLGIAGLAAGVILVGAYVTTLAKIQENRANALKAAIFAVLPGSTEYQAFVLEDGALRPYEGRPEAAPAGRVAYGGRGSAGQPVGFAIPAEGPGFQDTIALIYGLDPARRAIVGMEVLASRETPGLGDKIVKDEAFRANFQALSVEPKVVGVKKGRKAKPNEIDMITGATISSQALVDILNQSAGRWLPPVAANAMTLPPAGAPLPDSP